MIGYSSLASLRLKTLVKLVRALKGGKEVFKVSSVLYVSWRMPLNCEERKRGGRR